MRTTSPATVIIGGAATSRPHGTLIESTSAALIRKAVSRCECPLLETSVHRTKRTFDRFDVFLKGYTL
jgi:hypothetical protein